MQSASHKVFTQNVSSDKRVELETAAKSVRAILKTQPNDPNCLHVLGLIECQLGHIASARKYIEKSLKLRPNAPDVQCHYGLLLMEQHKYEDAIKFFRRALKMDPSNLDAHYHCGNALNESGRFSEAEEDYRAVLLLKPDHPEALNNLGNILQNRGNVDAAIPLYQKAIAANPDYAMAYNNLGLALVSLGELTTAAELYRKAIALVPDYAEAHNNLGIVVRLDGRYEDSIPFYERALELRPDYPDALNNLANALKDLGQLDQAIGHYERALELKDSADHRHNLSIAYLAKGRYEEGWRGYETRWEMKQMEGGRRHFKEPLWTGETGAGRTLLIHAEQGYGDTLQFCRYADAAKARGFRIILEAQAPLVRLLKSLSGPDEVLAAGTPLPFFDLQCPTLSLPQAFGTTVKTIPNHVPYLSATAENKDSWRVRLGADRKHLRVGLVWAGSPRPNSQDLASTDRRRSIAPELLAPLMDVPGVSFYNLQKFGAPAPKSFDLLDYMTECNDFADTAALLEQLDLIISVDTAVVHLAGALGKPVWVLNRFDSCWRWLQNRTDSPWYPTLTLFNQPRPRDWASVIDNVRRDLAAFQRARSEI